MTLTPGTLGYLTLAVTSALYQTAYAATATTQTQVRDENADKHIEVIEVIGDKGIATQLNPSNAEVAGIFGTAMTLKSLPRAATSLSQTALTTYNIESLHDIAKVAPNTYAASGFGTPSLPTVRGQLGELFQDGIRRQAGNNGFGIPFSFNSVGQLNVVKGPPTVLLGSTQRNGGFVDIRSKVASVSQTTGRVSFKAGRWDDYELMADYSTPWVKERTAVRFSAQIKNANSFYDFAEHKSENLYATFRYQPDNTLTWDLSAEYYDTEYPDIAGINRPTQALIDQGIYITGQGQQADGSFVPGAGAVISPTGQVRLPRHRVLTHPDDINNAQTSILRSNLTLRLSEHIALRNISYYQHLEREEIARNSFVEIIDGADTAQNRTEVDIAFNQNQLTTLALDIRYNDVLGYSQFTTEADNPIDLSGPLENRVIPLTAEQRQRLVMLRPGLFVSPGGQYDIDQDGQGDFNISDTTDSTTWQTGLAVQHTSNWTDKLTTIAGYRIDYYDVSAADALPPAGVDIPASDTYTDTLHSWQLNALYSLTDDLNFYVAIGENDATSNSMAGGTVLGADNRISAANFATENTLYEVGLKYSPFDALFTAISVFEQTRSLRNRDGSNSGIETSGLEAEAFYQGDGFWVNGSYSYLDAHYDDSAAAQGTGQVRDAFDASRPDIIQGTGTGSPAFTSFAASSRQLQGVAPQLASVNGAVDIGDAITLGASFMYTKSFPLDFLQTVRIRDQVRWDINATYQFSPQLQVRIDMVNVTDEENWQPVFEGGYFGATLAMPVRPRHTSATLQYRF
ncbi:TonB-dependent receptor [Salinimonas sp. HHU 13199]|uniref:TonB-dependent receptor n=1 Tax=Salinimonas profundi TaxID=2729140 RepID=A0ABR8LEX5_9ALTE|nr:TonB-dependent receptor [Salinimonas profundi]MBD3584821.1 TonB-dependent receptor [Salinimonas profundi]